MGRDHWRFQSIECIWFGGYLQKKILNTMNCTYIERCTIKFSTLIFKNKFYKVFFYKLQSRFLIFSEIDNLHYNL